MLDVENETRRTRSEIRAALVLVGGAEMSDTALNRMSLSEFLEHAGRNGVRLWLDGKGLSLGEFLVTLARSGDRLHVWPEPPGDLPGYRLRFGQADNAFAVPAATAPTR